jgi:glycerophosphoryl diester phosphodiesterase
VTAVYAHRGCREGVPENTLDAFAQARRLGADGVELDVRMTADGALAVHHDAEIPGLGPVGELAVSDLPAHVPLLAEALAVCHGMLVDIEIKNAPGEPGHDPTEAVAALTAAAVDEARWTGQVLVSSFQPATLRAVREADGRLALGILWAVVVDPALALAEAVEAGFGAVHPFVASVDEALVERAHRAGLAVNVWTVNAPEDLRAMARAGVDGVITDRLREALEVLPAG